MNDDIRPENHLLNGWRIPWTRAGAPMCLLNMRDSLLGMFWLNKAYLYIPPKGARVVHM